ncbi:hypothetical protein [Streptomyces sp. NPDC091027]|uniref:hypothetical protein n=1 Tax=Streptomyces sp. NPDC091027 TaxID=3365971 RepID=UPI0038156A45
MVAGAGFALATVGQPTWHPALFACLLGTGLACHLIADSLKHRTRKGPKHAR